MIKTFRAKNYGCLKDVTIGLTPLHAFVGPNDSGKSTILRGIRTVVQFAGGDFIESEDGLLPFSPRTTGRRITRKGSVPDSTDILLGCGQCAMKILIAGEGKTKPKQPALTSTRCSSPE